MLTDDRLAAIEAALQQQRTISRWLLGSVVVAGGLGAAALILPRTTVQKQEHTQAAATMPADSLTLRKLTVSGGPGGSSVVIEDGGIGILNAKGSAVARLSSSVDRTDLWLADSAGKTRINICASNVLGPSVRLFDSAGNARMALSAFTKGPSISLSDEDGHNRMLLAADKQSSNVGLFDENNNVRIAMRVKGDSSLILADENGIPRAQVSVHENGSLMNLTDDRGKPRAQLAVGKEGPQITLSDESGQVRAQVIADKGGSCMRLSDQEGKTRAALGATSSRNANGRRVDYPESNFVLIGPDGKVLFDAVP